MVGRDLERFLRKDVVSGWFREGVRVGGILVRVKGLRW